MQVGVFGDPLQLGDPAYVGRVRTDDVHGLRFDQRFEILAQIDLLAGVERADNKPYDDKGLAISRWAGIKNSHPQTGECDKQASGNEDAPSDAVPVGPPATE